MNMKRGQYSQFKKFLNSKLFIILGLVFLVLLAINGGKVLSKDYLMRKKIRELEKEAARLEAEQNRLTDLRDFFQSGFFIEQESRRSLGYVKPGEQVVIVEKNVECKMQNEECLKRRGDVKEISNPARWWNYFFHP